MAPSDIVKEIIKEIMDAYKKTHLDIDIMFVNECEYFAAISQHIDLIHCCVVASCNNNQVVNAMQRIINQYSKRGFAIKTLHGDNKFKQLEDWLTSKQVTLVTCDTVEHVPTIEHMNCFLKEGIRCTRADIPFTHVPKQFLVEVVKRVMMLVNLIPRKGGVHAALSPREPIKGMKLRVPKYKIGQYVQAHVKTTNDTGEERSVD